MAQEWVGRIVSTSFGLGEVVALRGDGIIRLENSAGNSYLGFFHASSLALTNESSRNSALSQLNGEVAMTLGEQSEERGILGFVHEIELEFPAGKRLRAEAPQFVFA